MFFESYEVLIRNPQVNSRPSPEKRKRPWEGTLSEIAMADKKVF